MQGMGSPTCILIKFIIIKAEMIERDFEGKKQMPQVATTLTKDVLLSIVGKRLYF
jgi:hypothetical protein